MNTLDQVLNDWAQACAAAFRQVDRHRVLGFPAAALPSRSLLSYATLAALGARRRLEESIRPEMEVLRAKGVLDPHIGIPQLSAGVLAAIETIRPHLRTVLDLVDAMTARALGSQVGRENEKAPNLRVPTTLRAACGQPVKIEISCAGADRLLIHASGLGLTRLITQPAQRYVLSLTFFNGELLVYAENDDGYSKLVRPMEVGAATRCSAPDRPFARASTGNVVHRPLTGLAIGPRAEQELRHELAGPAQGRIPQCAA